MNEVFDYKVYKIEIDGSISVDYSIYRMNGSERRMKIKLFDKPHEDFYKAYEAIKECFCQMFGLPLVDADTGAKLDVSVKKITFLNKNNYGDGMKITAEVNGIEQHSSPMKFTTLPYFVTELVRIPAGEFTEGGSELYCYVQRLTGFQLIAMRRIKEEAFAFAQCGKKEQPTLDEATADYFLGQGRKMNG